MYCTVLTDSCCYELGNNSQEASIDFNDSGFAVLAEVLARRFFLPE